MTTKTPVKSNPSAHVPGHESEPEPGIVHTVVASFRKLFGGPETSRERIDRDADVEHRAAWSLTITVEPDECDGGFIAETAEVPGAMGQGETPGEAARDLLDAVSAIMAVRLEQSFQATRIETPDGVRTLSVTV